MPQHLIPLLASATVLALALFLIPSQRSGTPVQADVAGVSASAPFFAPGQPLTITVSAEDDDGTLTIISNDPESELTVLLCTGSGPDQVAGECDGSGIASVDDQGSAFIKIDTDEIDSDDDPELITVLLTLVADCDEPAVLTITANQPGNVGPDDVTVNCAPEEETQTPTPTQTSTPTATPTATFTPVFTATSSPQITPTAEVLTTVIVSPSTGDGGGD